MKTSILQTSVLGIGASQLLSPHVNDCRGDAKQAEALSLSSSSCSLLSATCPTTSQSMISASGFLFPAAPPCWGPTAREEGFCLKEVFSPLAWSVLNSEIQKDTLPLSSWRSWRRARSDLERDAASSHKRKKQRRADWPYTASACALMRMSEARRASRASRATCSQISSALRTGAARLNQRE
jgi:hypothetical protein